MISVGIDVSKGKSTVFILNSSGEILESAFEVVHEKHDLIKLIEKLKQYNEPVRVVLEATGYYHWQIVNTLLNNGIYVTIVNPIIMNKFSKQSLRSCKTDRLDAVMIARYGLANWNELICCRKGEEIYAELNTYSRQYYQYIQLKSKAKINFSSILDKTMPGIEKLLSDVNGKLTDFIKKWWHFQCINQKSEKAFINSYEKWATKKRYRMSEQKAHEIYLLAQNGIPILPCTEATKQLVMEAVRVVQSLEQSISLILTHMQELASTLPEYKTVREMNCIGPVLAVRFISEIGDIRRFHSRNALIAYAGIDAPPYQSGNYESNNRHISKRGNKYLRKTGYELMMSLMQHKPKDDKVYQFILKKRAEGKYYLSAYMAGFNKFLRIYYAKVKENYMQ